MNYNLTPRVLGNCKAVRSAYADEFTLQDHGTLDAPDCLPTGHTTEFQTGTARLYPKSVAYVYRSWV